MKLGGAALGTHRECPNSNKRLTPADRERIVATARTGVTLKEICAATGWSWATVVRCLRMAGVTRPDKRAGRKSPRRVVAVASYRVPVFAGWTGVAA
jgi:bacteriorhodopsin